MSGKDLRRYCPTCGEDIQERVDADTGERVILDAYRERRGDYFILYTLDAKRNEGREAYGYNVHSCSMTGERT